MNRFMHYLGLAAFSLAVSSGTAHATGRDAVLPSGHKTMYGQPDRSASAWSEQNYVLAQDSTLGDLLVRIQRLEGENRRLNGRVEELEAQIARQQSDMKRMQIDNESRLDALEQGGAGGGSQPAPKPAQPQKRSDPRTPPTLLTGPENQKAEVGTQTQPVYEDGESPTATPPRKSRPTSTSSLLSPGLPGVAVDPDSQPQGDPSPGGEQAALTPEQQYTENYRLITAQKYEEAEAAFRNFVADYPKDRRVPDAVHWIGESLFQRKMYTEAAEQFSKVTKIYSKSTRAPSSMLKLGMALAALGEKQVACATFLAVGAKYPKASPTILNGAEREAKKSNCTTG